MAAPAATHDAVTRTSIAALQRAPSSLKLGAVILAVFVFVAITAPLWAPYSPTPHRDRAFPFEGPVWHIRLRTDELGRDVLSRVLFGTRDVLALSITSTFIAVFLGGSIGLCVWLCWRAGSDEVVMRASEILHQYPVAHLRYANGDRSRRQTGRKPPRAPRGDSHYVRSACSTAVVRAAALGCCPPGFRYHRGEVVEKGSRVYRLPRIMAQHRRCYARRVWYSCGIRSHSNRVTRLLGVWPQAHALSRVGADDRSENLQGITVSPETVLAPALAISVLVIGLNLVADGLARQLGRATSTAPL